LAPTSLSLLAAVGTLIAGTLTAVANVMIRVGILRFGGFKPTGALEVAWQFLNLLREPFFFFGFLLYFVAALVWFRVMAAAPLAIAYPLVVSVTFIAVTAGAALIWGEPLTVQKIAGLVLILAGIFLVSVGNVTF
jgi:multidrug transporter EmrE-like cation transporter